MGNFTLAEFIRSRIAHDRGIDNSMPAALMPAAARTLAGAERIRAVLGHPMLISSGYRCPELNALVGSKPTSQHLKAEAIDFTCPGFGSPQAIAEALLPLMGDLGIDQLILEATWVHCSFTQEPRCQALRCVEGVFHPGLA